MIASLSHEILTEKSWKIIFFLFNLFLASAIISYTLIGFLVFSVTTQCCYKKALENFTTRQIEKISNNFLLISYGQGIVRFHDYFRNFQLF